MKYKYILRCAEKTRSVKGEREKMRVIDWLIEMYVFWCLMVSGSENAGKSGLKQTFRF